MPPVLHEAYRTGHDLRFWERGRKTATPRAAEHFVAGFTAYLRSVVREAEARDSGIVLTTEAYLAIRLENIGVQSLCAMGELLLSIPDALYYHPLLARMMELECEIVTIDNVSSVFVATATKKNTQTHSCRSTVGRAVIQPRTSDRRRGLQHRHDHNAS